MDGSGHDLGAVGMTLGQWVTRQAVDEDLSIWTPAVAATVRVFVACAMAVGSIVAFVACGGASSNSMTEATGAAATGGSQAAEGGAADNSEYTPGTNGYIQGDRDSDDLEGRRLDEDDHAFSGFGHEGGTAEKVAIGVLVKRYYEAAARGDGKAACNLLDPTLKKQKSFVRFIPAVYAAVSSSSLFAHRSCADVESQLFELDRRTLQLGAPSVAVSSVRLEKDRGYALLMFKAVPERQIAVALAQGRWTIDALLDSELP